MLAKQLKNYLSKIKQEAINKYIRSKYKKTQPVNSQEPQGDAAL